jgi:regulation of enolase protein 1 (concanavalin A-like superfamily)
MVRSVACATVCALSLCLPSFAFADSIAVTSGSGFLYWDGSLTSITMSSADSQFVTEVHAGSDSGFSGGSTVDLSTTISVTNAGNHPLGQTYHGQQYQAWVSGSLSIVARPFVAPHAPPSADGTFTSFTTTFTMSGTITAWPTSDRSGTPLFSTAVTGGGTIISGGYRIIGDSYLQRSGELLAFSSPSSPPCSSWTSTDVGAVGFGGSALTCAPTIDVFGSGADIWGNADAFQFTSQPAPGDADFSAQLLSPVHNTASAATSPFAKAGLMIRQSVDPGSPQVILNVRPGGGIEFMTRSTSGGPTTFVAGGSTSFPVWLRLVRRGGTVTGYTSGDGVSWTAVGNASAPTGDARVGFAVTSHDNSARDQAAFAHVGLWRLPNGWSQQDVGAVGRAGNGTVTDDVFTVTGAGSDIWGSADAFDAVTQAVGANATIVARVVDETNTHMFAKAGISIGSLAPGAARVVLDVRPDGNIEFMARLADGSAMSFLAGASTTLPVWLRLERASAQFTGSMSSDGAAWTTIGTVNVAMPATVRGGLVVNSHDPSALSTATFDHVSVTAAVSSTPPTGAPQPGTNILRDPGFELDTPPAFATPGWVSDAARQTPAQSESVEPRSGARNGACRTTSSLDCGLYQDIAAPVDGTYTYAVYANASRGGAWVGVNVNGAGVQSAPVAQGAAGAYAVYSMSFTAKAGDVIRVWLYSPAVPGSAVIDDARLSY